MSFKVGNLVRRRVDGVIMVIIDSARLRAGRDDWTCAWMEGHRRCTSDFTQYEIEHHEPRTIEGAATEVTPLRAIAKEG